jgi:NADH-quinone oxidoreductase subunit F
VVHLLEEIEAGRGSLEMMGILHDHVKLLNYAFCALAPGAMGPVEGLLRQFGDELEEHVAGGRCPLNS